MADAGIVFPARAESPTSGSVRRAGHLAKRPVRLAKAQSPQEAQAPAGSLGVAEPDAERDGPRARMKPAE